MKLLFLLLASIAYGCQDNACGDYLLDIENSVALRTFQMNADYPVANSEDSQISTRRSFNNRINIKAYDLFEVHSDIDLYDITRPLGKVHNVSLAYEDSTTKLQTGYQINALYATLNLTESVSLYHGAIPFKGGRFSEIKDPTINGGNGLAIISNQVYSSDFISYHDDYSVIIGKSEFNTKNHYNGLMTKNEGSSGTYFLANYELGKHFIEFDYYAMKVNMGEVKDYADLQIGGIGYIYDDSIDSGLTLYTNLGMSNISENVMGLMNSYGVRSPEAINYYKNTLKAHTTNTKDVKGYAGLFGVNYEFDLGNTTVNFGVEEFITRGGWVSANHGVAFLSDHSWYAVRNGFETSLYAGANLTKNLRVSTKYVHTESQDVVNAFSISQNASRDKALNGNAFYKRFDKLEFLVNYVF